MTPKSKIEKYVKTITKNDTYTKYLQDAAEFGYNLAAKDIADLQKQVKTYEDLLKNDVLSEGFIDDDY